MTSSTTTSVRHIDGIFSRRAGRFKAHLHFGHRLTTSIADSRDNFSLSRSKVQPASVAGENGTVNIRTTSLALFRRRRQLAIFHQVGMDIP
jgi:hypothetical protein